MSRTRWSLIALVSSASWNGRTRPSQLTNAPTFSACGATGRTTSATAVTAESRISRETTKVLARASSTPRVAEVGRVDATDDERVDLAGAGRLDDAVGVTGRRVGQPDDVPDLGDLGAGLGARRPDDHREAALQRAGLERAALTGPPRDPRQPGAGALGERGGGRQGAGHRGEPLPDEDDASVLERLERRAAGLEPPRSRSTAVSLPGTGRQQPGRELVEAAGGEGRDRIHLGLGAPHALAKPQEDDRRLVLRLEPDEQHGLGVLEVGVGHRTAVGAGGHTCLARKSASSTECGRARKSMSLVCSAMRANFPYA